MSSQTAAHANSLPPGKSLWDKLPVELQEEVFHFASPLTLFVNDRLDPTDKLDAETMHKIWFEVFDIDWSGDLSLLPDILKSTLDSIETHQLCRVKSRSLYDRLCKRFPQYTESNPKFGESDVNTEKIMRTETPKCVIIDDVPRIRLLHIAMHNMWLDVIQESIDKHPYARANDCIVGGHTDLLRHLVKTRNVNLQDKPRWAGLVTMISLFTRGPTTDLGKMSHQVNRCGGTELVMNIAAKFGHLDILVMLHKAGNNSITTDAMNWAAGNGHLAVVKWLHQNRSEGCSIRAIENAAKGGHFEVVKFLHENRSEGCNKMAMDYAAEGGFLEIVKFLHEHRSEGCTVYAMDRAAGNGHFEVVKYLHENRSEGCSWAMHYAASSGHLKIVKFLHQVRGEKCMTATMTLAAAYGYLDVVQYMHENISDECKKKAMDLAALAGYLHVVKWLHEHCTAGCTFDAIDNAARNGCIDTIKWLLENRTEGFTQAAIDKATYFGHPQIVELLNAHKELMKHRVVTEDDLMLMNMARSYMD